MSTHRLGGLLVAAVLGLTLGGCGRQEPVDSSGWVDPTEQLPARFKTQEPVGIPDFSAAASSPSFRQAIADAAALLDAEPQPLRSAGEGAEVKGGVSFAVSTDRLEAILREAHREFLERGFYLFRHEQHFGIGGQPDRVGLLPTADRYAVMAAMSTNGDNYGIGTAGVVAWMKELEAEQPYLLTGIAFDSMEGYFTSPVQNPDDLARRMYQFCPDIVDQGVGRVEALAVEIRKGDIYFWWD